MGGLLGKWIVAIALAVVSGGCASRAPGSVEATVEGALRASVTYVIAPEAYRAGVLPPGLASDWIARGDTEFARWYAGAALDAQRLGLRNVVLSKTEVAGAIATAIDVQQIDVGQVDIDGDHARVTDATLFYITRFAPGTWDPVAVSGVTMCLLDLRRINGEWRVVDESCNVSGG